MFDVRYKKQVTSFTLDEPVIYALRIMAERHGRSVSELVNSILWNDLELQTIVKEALEKADEEK